MTTLPYEDMEGSIMFKKTNQELAAIGANITVREIEQQPELWLETLEIVKEHETAIQDFLQGIKEKHGHAKVIFTGAGTSAYVGNTALPYLLPLPAMKNFTAMSVATTDIVSNPYEFLEADVPTLLVSFARSGNSPESLAAVHLGKEIVNDFYQLNITCAADGQLAKQSKAAENAYLMLMPPRSNDAGFAMTGSFSCMLLATLQIFDGLSYGTHQAIIKEISKMGQQIITDEAEIDKIMALDFERIIYLGSGSLAGLTREAQLKVLELTAGQIATLFDSSMGFRHGPKSFTQDQTLIFTFVSNNEYTQKYDVDILEEVKADGIASLVMGIFALEEGEALPFDGDHYRFNKGKIEIPDVYLALPYLMFAQILAVKASIKVGNKPDTPSPTGTVNRVVKGVTIHPYGK